METKSILENLMGVQVYCTTRGTTGDAQGMLLVDEDTIASFESAEVCPLHELKNINTLAYSDCIDYIDGDPVLSSWDKDDFLVIYQDCDYLLVWESYSNIFYVNQNLQNGNKSIYFNDKRRA